MNSCLTPVATEYLLHSSSEGWGAAVSAGEAISIHVPFSKREALKNTATV